MSARIDPQQSPEQFLVIGAGPVGLAMSKALGEQGLPHVVAEATDHVGGNWAHGVYTTAHIISSRTTTEFPDYPMPADYPDFPSAPEMRAYYEAMADDCDLRPRIAFETPVEAVAPRDDGTWAVRFGTGVEAVFKGVFVCNGHHWDKQLPEWTEAYAGAVLHSKDYKEPAQLAGKRVLVLGGGNSGCDLASEAARVGAHCDWSLRRGYWFMPKSVFGRPSVELIAGWIPVWVQRLAARLLVRIVLGSYADYGLPEPDHKVYEAHPTVNSEVFHYLQHGRIRPVSDVARVEGRRVCFADGIEEEYDLVVCATGYAVSFPFLPDGMVEVRGKTPQVLGGALVPGVRNLYIVGAFQPRYGIGPVVRPYVQLLAAWAELQDELSMPIADVLAAMGVKPERTHLIDPHAAIRKARWGRRTLGLVRWKARRMG